MANWLQTLFGRRATEPVSPVIPVYRPSAEPPAAVASVGAEQPIPDEPVVGCSALVIDFETATEDPASACAVGLVWIADRAIAARAFHLIQPPGNRYAAFNTGLHGIGAAHTAASPSFADLWPRLRRHFTPQSLPIVAHNAAFDARVLAAALAHYGIIQPPFWSFCTVKLARGAWPGLTNYKLPTVAAHLGHAFRHHDALSDAEACAFGELCSTDT